jgi:hypothetical protein
MDDWKAQLTAAAILPLLNAPDFDSLQIEGNVVGVGIGEIIALVIHPLTQSPMLT